MVPLALDLSDLGGNLGPMSHVPAHLLAGGGAYRWMQPDESRDQAKQAISLLGCGFVRKPAGEDGRDRGDWHWSMVLCLSGSGTYRDHTGHDHPVTPGTLVQRFTDHPHGLRLGPDWAECWIAFGVPLERMLLSNGIIRHDAPVLTVGIDLALLRELATERDALRSAADSTLPLHLVRLQGLLLSFLAGATRDQDRAFDVAKACRRLAEEPEVDVGQVAQEAGLGYERFRKVFRERTGLSPGAWRIQRRLDRARTLLMTTDLQVQAIAEELGYADAFAFTAQFRTHVGCPPREYRQRQRR